MIKENLRLLLEFNVDFFGPIYVERVHPTEADHPA
jgi:hypothetical protein